jgi:hypothetical protein
MTLPTVQFSAILLSSSLLIPNGLLSSLFSNSLSLCSSLLNSNSAYKGKGEKLVSGLI